jgi:hypothetical protein
MRYRKLRIAWSVMCGIGCLLLIVLWVRSYSCNDHVHFPVMSDRMVTIDSTANRLSITTYSLYRPLAWHRGITLPHWCLILIASALAAVPWLRWRFSLRTLLIATTLIAVVLGIIVWMSRAG